MVVQAIQENCSSRKSFQRAFAQSIFNGRENTTAVDLLVSITNENNNASYFLAVNGFDRQKLIEVLLAMELKASLVEETQELKFKH